MSSSKDEQVETPSPKCEAEQFEPVWEVAEVVMMFGLSREERP
jgi:hypothetical protein